MKITKIMVNRKFNLGNYESLDMAAEAEISEADNPLEILAVLRDNIEMEYIAMQNKKTQPAPSTTTSPFKRVEPKKEEPKTKSGFKDETIKNVVIETNGDIKTIGFIHDRELWARINDDLKANGYRWISEGKNSHWQKEA